jgi:capsular exopolysaccharide synthesis family protein
MNLSTWKDFLAILESNTRVSQTFETLLSSLTFVERGGSPLSTLMISSTQPHEGKSTISALLALTMALAGRRVLLIDADARRPKLHEIFEVSYKHGFTDILDAGSSLTLGDVVQKVPIPRDRTAIDIIPSGTLLPIHSNPLASPRLESLVKAASEQYENVLFDSPPALSVSDPCFLAPFVKGVLFVVGSGTVQERDAKLAKARIEKAGGHLVGFVMNRFDATRYGPGYHPYEGYYDPTKE